MAVSASQRRQVMRLKPKRCSRRKVEYQLERQFEHGADDDEGGDQRDLVGERAGARRDRSRAPRR